MKRWAIVEGHKGRDVAAYLPTNYEVVYQTCDDDAFDKQATNTVLICGVDNAGWTLDQYVIPRLGSGLIACTEVWPVFIDNTPHEPLERLPVPDEWLRGVMKQQRRGA